VSLETLPENRERRCWSKVQLAFHSFNSLRYTHITRKLQQISNKMSS